MIAVNLKTVTGVQLFQAKQTYSFAVTTFLKVFNPFWIAT